MDTLLLQISTPSLRNTSPTWRSWPTVLRRTFAALASRLTSSTLKESHDLVTQLQWEKNKFCLKMLRQKRTITRLHKKISDQNKLI